MDDRKLIAEMQKHLKKIGLLERLNEQSREPRDDITPPSKYKDLRDYADTFRGTGSFVITGNRYA
ncbi:MAG: hypothetical protein LBT92_01495 [Rickettsiales bacterium]|jgi:hypothetical protein|nr:hypothetical protein [Rickettsiales bacterium]